MRRLRLPISILAIAITLGLSVGISSAQQCNCTNSLDQLGLLIWDENGVPHCRANTCSIITGAMHGERIPRKSDRRLKRMKSHAVRRLHK